MRTITYDAVKRFYYNQNFKRSNTEVEKDGNRTFFYLHGNCIAAYNPTEKILKISHAGRRSNTTKERLNGILRTFNLGRIFQKDFSRYYENENGKIEPMQKVMEFSL